MKEIRFFIHDVGDKVVYLSEDIKHTIRRGIVKKILFRRPTESDKTTITYTVKPDNPTSLNTIEIEEQYVFETIDDCLEFLKYRYELNEVYDYYGHTRINTQTND